MTRIIAVTNYKGGTGKTTSTVYLAHAYERMGKRVLIVDADTRHQDEEDSLAGSGSARKWKARTHFNVPILAPRKGGRIDEFLAGVILDDYDLVLIDTAPADGADKIVTRSIGVADMVVMPTSGDWMEVEQLGVVKAKIPDGKPYVIIMCRDQVNSKQAKDMRDALLAGGDDVLAPAVPRRNHIRDSYVQGLDHQMFGYDLLAKQILSRMEASHV